MWWEKPEDYSAHSVSKEKVVVHTKSQVQGFNDRKTLPFVWTNQGLGKCTFLLWSNTRLGRVTVTQTAPTDTRDRRIHHPPLKLGTWLAKTATSKER